MTPPLSPGCVRIAVTVADRAVAAASVACDRPKGLSALAAAHPPDQIPDLIGRLHALCAVSQSLAARAALAAAGAAVAPPDPETAGRRLAAERLVELLRATAIGFSDVVPPRPEEAAALRQALAAGGDAAAGEEGGGPRLGAALAVLGLDRGEILPRSWAGRVGECVSGLGGWEEGAADPLGPDDDAAVAAALLHSGEAFAARPVLPGRRVWTGPVARAARSGRPGLAPLAARWAEIADAARRLDGAGADPSFWLRAGAVAPGIGFSAVEGPRGRLHHLAVLGRNGCVVRYHVLAPTEWTFAPGGPFAAALARLRLAGPDRAERAVARLAALFDPCVACEIVVTHA